MWAPDLFNFFEEEEQEHNTYPHSRKNNQNFSTRVVKYKKVEKGMQQYCEYNSAKERDAAKPATSVEGERDRETNHGGGKGVK